MKFIEGDEIEIENKSKYILKNKSNLKSKIYID